MLGAGSVVIQDFFSFVIIVIFQSTLSQGAQCTHGQCRETLKISINRNIKIIAKQMFPGLYTRWVDWQKKTLPNKVANILSHSELPQHYDDEDVFARLQYVYKKDTPKYGYDKYSTWRRGSERAINLLRADEFQEAGLNVLDAACGDGMMGYALACYGHRVTLIDLDDWRDVRAKHIPFVGGNLCKRLPFDSKLFDLVYSFNAFEHVEDPVAALAQLVRVSKTGAYIYIDFGPLYASPWGLHAYRTIFMPYSQFLFSTSFIEKKLRELGICDLGKKRTCLQPLNRWQVSRFRHLWKNSGCDIISYTELKTYSYLALIDQFPKAFTGRGLTLEDVTTHHITIMLRKQ